MEAIRGSENMLIMGIDPGLRITGYGAIVLGRAAPTLVEAGIIRTADKNDLAARLAELAGGLREVFEGIDPEVVVVESLYSHYKHPSTAILMGHARGVVILSAAELKIPVIDYPATRIKKALTGNGRASKLQMQRTILHTMKLENMPEPPDVADALAVALCHANVIMRKRI
jgi:crossover junction endodeoxyribonuclease RuvC